MGPDSSENCPEVPQVQFLWLWTSLRAWSDKSRCFWEEVQTSSSTKSWIAFYAIFRTLPNGTRAIFQPLSTYIVSARGILGVLESPTGNVTEIRCLGPGAWHPLPPSWVPPKHVGDRGVPAPQIMGKSGGAQLMPLWSRLWCTSTTDHGKWRCSACARHHGADCGIQCHRSWANPTNISTWMTQTPTISRSSLTEMLLS